MKDGSGQLNLFSAEDIFQLEHPDQFALDFTGQNNVGVADNSADGEP